MASVLTTTQRANIRQSSAAVGGSGDATAQVAGATSQSASAQNDNVQQTRARRRRDKRRGAAASPNNDAASADAASDRPFVPFYGFSDEYIEAHAMLGNEAIRRINIIISLIKSGKLTERQTKTLLPWCKLTCLITG